MYFDGFAVYPYSNSSITFMKINLSFKIIQQLLKRFISNIKTEQCFADYMLWIRKMCYNKRARRH